MITNTLLKVEYIKREIALFAFILLNVLAAKAQYTNSNSVIRKAIVSYEIDSKGYYQKTTNKMLDVVDGVVENYAYEKKAQNLYLLTANSNCVVTLIKDYASFIKKNKGIPHLDDEELESAIQKANKTLDDKYAELNRLWAKHIQDSIAKAEIDSLEAVRQCKEQKEKHDKELSDYRKTHDWQWLPIKGHELPCSLCEDKCTSDSVYCLGILNDSIYYGTLEKGKLNLSYSNFHVCKIPSALATDPSFTNHYEAYKDSLTKKTILCSDFISYINYQIYDDYLTKLKRKAPYGFFENWGWSDEYSMIKFDCEYTNTYARTIRYIDIYFKVTNDVNDVRLVGHFRGTGPLKEFETASWNWDSSLYFVSGDATNMDITKVIITYMNGTKKVLTGRLLQFNNSDDE
jgi:hypothetical protein